MVALGRKHSDHKPLLVSSGIRDVSPKPFKIFNCFLTDSLLEEVNSLFKSKKGWKNANIQKALKDIKVTIKRSSKGAKEKIDEEIQQLELKEDKLDNSTTMAKELLEIRMRLKSLYDHKESMLSQKARINWLKLGDGNTKFFHQVVQRRKSKNTITKLYWGSTWLTEPKMIKQAFFEHYSEFFGSGGDSLLDLGLLTLPRLSDKDSQALVRPIHKQEMTAALGSMGDDKPSGPDGLNVRSLKFLWPFISSKMENFISTFHDTAAIPAGLNSSFVTLIPKNVDPSTVRDYRPISLINTSIKVLTKVLASRLAAHMGYLTSDTQSGFTKGRQASKGILVVKEIVHSLQKNKCKGMVIKLDFEKAFDTIKWEFLFSVLEKMNFDAKWLDWIKSLLSTSRISILVNGSPTKEFSPRRGLRQGDPLSPLLFNLVAEVLSSMLNEAANKGIFGGITLDKSSPPITHL